MLENLTIALITILSGSTVATIVTSILARRQVKANVAKTIGEATSALLTEYRRHDDEQGEEIAQLKNDLVQLRNRYEEEQAVQDKVIEDTNAKILKLELINIILVAQMREKGIKPLIDAEDIYSVTIGQLEDIIRSLRDLSGGAGDLSGGAGGKTK